MRNCFEVFLFFLIVEFEIDRFDLFFSFRWNTEIDASASSSSTRIITISFSFILSRTNRSIEHRNCESFIDNWIWKWSTNDSEKFTQIIAANRKKIDRTKKLRFQLDQIESCSLRLRISRVVLLSLEFNRQLSQRIKRISHLIWVWLLTNYSYRKKAKTPNTSRSIGKISSIRSNSSWFRCF